MRKRATVIGIVIALVALVALAGGWAAFAQSPTATPPAKAAPGTWGEFGRGGMRVGGMHRGGMDQTALAAAASALGMSADELSTQLWGGKTLADLATSKGVDLQKVKDAVTAAETAATKASIEQAVKDGTLTRDKADWLIAGLDKGYWGGQAGPGFFGKSGNMGGRGGKLGRFGGPNAQPTAQPSGSSS